MSARSKPASNAPCHYSEVAARVRACVAPLVCLVLFGVGCASDEPEPKATGGTPACEAAVATASAPPAMCEPLLANAAEVTAVVAPYLPKGAPPLRVVIDDGWQRGWGDWRPNQKFPDGISGLATTLHNRGLSVGIWLAPLLVLEDSALAKAHPAWFVKGAAFVHLKMGRLLVLDATHPEAAAHLHETITTIVSWGVDLLKIDFLFAGLFNGGRHADVTATESFNLALSVIRDAAGPDTVLLGVGAPPIPTLKWVDAWRMGPDIAVENFGAVWAFLPNELRAMGARWPLCRATLCDPDPPVLRTLSQDEVDFGAWTVALAGGAWFLSDDLRTLPKTRRTWGHDQGRVDLSLAGVPAEPESVFMAAPPKQLSNAIFDHLRQESTHVVPAIWRLSDGRRVGFNVGDTATIVAGVPVPSHAARLLPD